jgi:flagellar biosynthesis chaperone FliJ
MCPREVTDLREGYEERICGHQNEIIDRDAQIETLNLKILDYQ